jgi:hypothetical protein
MKVIDFILLAFLLGLLLIGGNVMLKNISWFSQENIKYQDYVSNLTVDAKAAKVAQFYPNMRYPESVISYTIEDVCSLPKRQSIREALEILSNNTILRFQEKESDGEIRYLCSNTAPSAGESNHFVAGEGGPTGIVNTTLFSVITSGQVSLYRAEKCDKPQVALHETLHALGFDHVKDKNDIMFPITECEQQPNPLIYEYLDTLYGIRTAPDLGIEYVRANQTGKYLNFYITIENYGLKDSNSSSLIILADEEQVKEFDLGAIKMGTKKFLNVQNMRLDRKADTIRFLLRITEDDLYDENNFAELYLNYNGNQNLDIPN